MTSKLATITDNPNPDGSYDAVFAHDDELIEFNIPLERVQELVARFQAQIFALSPQMQCAQLAVHRIEIARKEATCELMVSTVQSGTVVLAMSNADLRHMKKEIDRVLAYRGGSSIANQ